MGSFVRSWTEGLDAFADMPHGDGPAVHIPEKPELKAVGEKDKGEGELIGNLGAKIVGTLMDWISPSGFLSRVKNPEVLDEGISKLEKAIHDFNNLASRVSSRSLTRSKSLREIQSPWFFTVGARLQEMKSTSKGDKDKALRQLKVLAPKLERKWNKFVDDNDMGVRVTNPEVIQAPTGAPEQETPEPEAPEPTVQKEFPDVMAGAPSGPGLARPGNLGALAQTPF